MCYYLACVLISVSTVPNMIWILQKLTWYFLLWLKGKVNRQLSKKRTNIYLSIFVTRNSLLLWTFSLVQLVLILPWRLTRVAKRKGFSRMNRLIVPKNGRIRHFHRTTSFSADYVIATHSIKSSFIIKISSTLDAAMKKRFKKSEILQVSPHDQKIRHIYSKYGKTTTFNPSKGFLWWYNNKDVVPTLEAMTKKTAFYHFKRINIVKLGCTLPNLANICFHSSTKFKFYPFPEGDKAVVQKLRRHIFGVPSIVFTRKAVVGQARILSSSKFANR